MAMNDIEQKTIGKFDEIWMTNSKGDHLDDLRNVYSSLLSDSLIERYYLRMQGVVPKKTTVELIKLHVRIALSYLDDSIKSSIDTSFLPSYYCFLNVAKVFMIFKLGPERVRQNSLHGASYKRNQKRQLDVYPEGSIPSFIYALHDIKITEEFKISADDLLKYTYCISADYADVHQAQKLIHHLVVSVRLASISNGNRMVVAELPDGLSTVDMPDLELIPAFRNLKIDQRNQAVSKVYIDKSIPTAQILSECLDRSYFTDVVEIAKENKNGASYLIGPYQFIRVPVFEKDFKHRFGQEVNLLLLFYFMSCVCRYNPLELDKLKKSESWSIFLALRSHGAIDFLEAMWSNIIGKSYIPKRV